MIRIEGHRTFELYNDCPGCGQHVLAHLRMRQRIGSALSFQADRGYTEYLRGRACPLCYHQWQEYEKVYN